ncbi:MAG: hypothetical protein HYR85_08830 [Planctomycetes bacterium]|nr:hypothetical protein [Planctomycetota bacterium]MBI3847247.1 hypothetical protein [Planctomycetota bacterium]
MSYSRKLVSCIVAALAASPALAQDSVSSQQGLPGDAVSAYDLGEQRNNYVVDLQSFASSWGTTFGIAPIIKASKDSAAPQAFFTSQLSAQAASDTVLTNVPFAFNSYDSWSGQGIGINPNPNLNSPGTAINTTGRTGIQFGVMFSEFGGNSNNIIGGVVNYQTTNPARLFVSRINAAVNGTDGTCNIAQVGAGAVDSNGNTYFRADDFGVQTNCGALVKVTLNNYYRVRMLARNAGSLNILNAATSSDAASTDVLLSGNATTHNTPNCIPQSVIGRPCLIGSNFSNRYVREATAGTTTADSTHLDPLVTDHRGAVGYTHSNFAFIGSVNGVAGLLGKIGGSGSDTDTMNIWGIGNNAAVTGTLALTLPASNLITDPTTGFVPATTGSGRNVFTHNGSQTGFRGGSGQVALGVDQAGRLLTAATVAYPTFVANNNPFDYIAVARTDSSGQTEWTIAAYSLDDAFASRGKPILDGPGGNIVGYLTSLANVTGGSPLGPSISCPMMDSVGNLYFMAAVERLIPSQASDFDSALVRAVYNPTNFSYELELLFDAGRIFHGNNSNTDYQIRFLTIADADSISSGSTYSSNIIQSAHRGIDPSALAPRSPDTLGGLVLGAEIVYDVNGDGQFNKVTGANGDPNSLDQEYNVLLYVGSVTPDPEIACRAGNINTGAASTPANTVFINGQTGSTPDRVVNVTPTTPFTLRIDQTPAGGRRYAMYVWVGAPTAATLSNLPFNVGTICRRTPLTAGSGQPAKIANNVGRPQLGTENWPGPPTQPANPSYTLLNVPAGLHRTGTFFFQGIELDPGSPSGQAGVTNGIVVVSQ